MDDPYTESKSILLNNGSDLHLQDEGEISIVLMSNGEELSKVSIPNPSSGYGGGSILVSPSQKYLVFSYYSGQSEEAFRLYSISSGLKEVFELDYQFGEAASFGFNKDESQLIMAFPYSCGEWWELYEDEPHEVDENGNSYFEFGEILALKISEKIITQHIIRLTIPENWEPPRNEYNPCLYPSFNSNSEIVVSMPWGDIVLSRALENIVIIDPRMRGNNA